MLIIKIQNDGTGTVEVGNYRYQVLINQIVIESGEVKGHVRRKGWQNLVAMLLQESVEMNLISLGIEAKNFVGDSDHEHDDRIL